MELLHRAAHVMDLLATPLSPSHYLELVNPLWSGRRLCARIESARDETEDARTLTLRPSRGFRVPRAGQHVRVGVVIAGRQMTRTYSISSSPDRLRKDGCFTITVKTFEGARVSHFLVRDARSGTMLSIGQPEGDFCLPDAAPARLLFITAGSGITPVMSMLRTFASRGAMPDAVHIHYARHPDDVIFRDELRRTAMIYTRRLHPLQETAPKAHFTAEQLDERCPDWRARDVWACGPQGLLDALTAHFARAGRASSLHIERFAAPLLAIPDGPHESARGGAVHFRKSGLQTRTDGRKVLLRVAEDAGIDAPHGCRMGVCHTCDATLLSGCARDLRTGHEINEPGARVQLCVSAAAGNLELDL